MRIIPSEVCASTSRTYIMWYSDYTRAMKRYVSEIAILATLSFLLFVTCCVVIWVDSIDSVPSMLDSPSSFAARSTISLLFVWGYCFFLPGFWILRLFEIHKDCDWLDTFFLSIWLSFSIIPIMCLPINLFWFPINTISITLISTAVILIWIITSARISGHFSNSLHWS